jgi:hypothetical protein
LMEAGAVRTFASPDLAMQALVEWRGEPFDELPLPPLGIQLLWLKSEEELWRELIEREERNAVGSLETMIEDASSRLVAAMRELRTTKSQRRANWLRQIIEGQSNRLAYLARFVNKESQNLQWLKVDRAEPESMPKQEEL